MLEVSKPNTTPCSWWSPFARAVVEAMILSEHQTDFDAGYEDATKHRPCNRVLARHSMDYRHGYRSALSIITDIHLKQRLNDSIPNPPK